MPIPRLLLPAAAFLVPLLLALAAVLFVRRRRRVAAALGDPLLLQRLMGGDLHRVPWTRLALLLCAGVALSAALLDPRSGAATEQPVAATRDVVFVLDASNSMLVEDVAPSRLERQRLTAHRIARELAGDRLGVVAFAGDANVLAPPTLDHAAVAMYIDLVRPQIAVQTGSALAAGVRAGTSLLAAGPPGRGSRLLVLISDGEPIGADQEGAAALAAARRAAALGVTIHTVGIGTYRGGPVPDVDPVTGDRRGYKVDPATGSMALSRLDDELLRQIARETGGAYHTLADLAALEALLERLRPEQHPGAEPPPPQRLPRYVWFVALALLLLTAESWVAVPRARTPASAGPTRP